jgi:hypothetical protein
MKIIKTVYKKNSPIKAISGIKQNFKGFGIRKISHQKLRVISFFKIYNTSITPLIK